jgi:hypothetical protein
LQDTKGNEVFFVAALRGIALLCVKVPCGTGNHNPSLLPCQDSIGKSGTHANDIQNIQF